jgi:hypothetical protein
LSGSWEAGLLCMECIHTCEEIFIHFIFSHSSGCITSHRIASDAALKRGGATTQTFAIVGKISNHLHCRLHVARSTDTEWLVTCGIGWKLENTYQTWLFAHRCVPRPVGVG